MQNHIEEPKQLYSLCQKAFAEFFGTLVFFFVIQMSLGSIVELGLFFAIISFGSVSGGHFNPMVTIGFMVKQVTPVIDGVVYIISQIAGGYLSAYLTYNFNHEISGINSSFTIVLDGHTFTLVEWQALLIESIGSSLFLFLIFSQTTKKTQISENPFFIAALITLSLKIFRSIAVSTGGFLNPAAALCFTTLVGHTGALNNLWIYLLSGLIAGIFTPFFFKFYEEYIVEPQGEAYNGNQQKKPLNH